MSKKITREIIQTNVFAVIVEVVDGAVVTKPLQSIVTSNDEYGEEIQTPVDYVTFNGTITPEKAQKILSKDTGLQLTVIKTEQIAHRYEMPVETFVKNATLITE